MEPKPPRTKLDTWREQNRDRDGAPSQLLKQMRATMEGAQRFAQTPHMRVIGKTVHRIAQAPHVREIRERWPPMQANRIAEKLMGRMRPASLPSRLAKAKRKPGAGRKPSITPEQKAEGIRILRSKPRMSVDAACAMLRDAGIAGGNTTLYEWIVKPAYSSRS
jgi:hypothetical protein